ncbi:TLR2 [Mytilus coruscus]|uniref:TLR2 n=1 Tax=Mytilus coruscus TaxID=42192 RepID=A0A6J8AJ64_MYTCO|nr:TLR2 [Mytilus coruscus]
MVIEILSGRRHCDISNNRNEFEGFKIPNGCKYDSDFPNASANGEIIELTLSDRLNCNMLYNLFDTSGAKFQMDYSRGYLKGYNITNNLDNKFYAHVYVYDLQSDIQYINFSLPKTCSMNIRNCHKFKAMSEEETKVSDNKIYSIKIKGSEVFKNKQLPLPCSLWENIPHQSKWYLDRLSNVSILFRVNNISLYRCTFRNDHFHECATTSKLSLIEYTSIRCLKKDGTMKKVFKLNTNNELGCNNPSQVVVYMFISYCVLTLILGVFTCRKSKLYYAARHKLKLSRRKGYKRQIYTFDAFISYSHADIDWVLKFYKKLQSLGHRISFDEKDFLVGAFISDNIYQALNESRKVIFIVTEHFLESTWDEFELEVARSYASKKGRHDMIIVVLKDDIDINRMPNGLKEIWYKITCIKWFTSKDKHNDDINEYENKCIRKVHKAISGDMIYYR